MKYAISFLFCLALFFSGLNAQNTITCEGKSSLLIKPEIMAFYINFEVIDTDYQTAIDRSIEGAKNVTEKFKSLGVKDAELKTSSYSVNKVQQYNQSTRKQEFKGYRASMRLIVKLNYADENVDKVFNVIRSELNTLFDLRFELSPDQKEEAKNKLIELAIADAKSKAHLIAKTTEVSLGKVQNVEYGEQRLIRTPTKSSDLMTKEVMAVKSATSAQISETLNPQEIELRTNIVISWGI